MSICARILVLVICLAPLAAPGAPPADLDRYVERAMKRFDVPGMSVGITEGEGRTFARGYGVRRLGERGRVDERTVFAIGSNTKAFTAAALAILVDAGQLGWDDRVVDRLPGFRMYDPYASHEMTVRDLLVHRSGLGLGAGDLLFFPPTDYSRAEIVQRLRYIPPARSFRSGYAYDNVLYIVAGQLIEEVTKQSWEEFIQNRVLTPIGMQDSVPVFTSAKGNVAWPHARLQGEVRGTGDLEPLPSPTKLDNAAPAGSIGASAADMVRWLRVQLDRGALGTSGDRLFSEASAREMWKPHTIIPGQPVPEPIALSAPAFNTYALGWVVRDYRGAKIVTHSGGVEGTLSLTAMIPGKGVGIVVMINSEDGGALRAVFNRLLDHYLGQRSPDWIAAYAEVQEQRIEKALETLKKAYTDAPSGGGPSLPFAKYAGVYRDPWYGTVTIVSEGDDVLKINFDHSPGMSSVLEHVRHDTFRTRFADRRIEDTYVTFALRPDGSIDRMTMQAVSPIADFSFDYHDLLFEPVKPQ